MRDTVNEPIIQECQRCHRIRSLQFWAGQWYCDECAPIAAREKEAQAVQIRAKVAARHRHAALNEHDETDDNEQTIADGGQIMSAWNPHGVCERCDRETKTTYVDGYGQLCITCCDYLAEATTEAALEALDERDADADTDANSNADADDKEDE